MFDDMAKNTQISARNREAELNVSHSEIDSPVLDVNALERLHTFRPDLVDFVIEETKKEAAHRREHDKRTLDCIFKERMTALGLAFVIAIGGVGGGIYAASQGFLWLAATIVSACIGSLAVAFVKRDK